MKPHQNQHEPDAQGDYLSEVAVKVGSALFRENSLLQEENMRLKPKLAALEELNHKKKSSWKI